MASSRSALACAWPCMLAVALLLLPFVHTPFTIDDPIYMYEARHVLTDPLHPQAFELVWSLGERLRASQILPGGFTAAYLLVPAALAGSREWVGHLTEMILLIAAIYATALLALRLGLKRRDAAISAWLAGSAPAVLGAAGTLMPDIAAMLFTALGAERAVAWRDTRRGGSAALAAFWLGLAILTRVQTLALWPAIFVLLLDGLEPTRVRASLASFRRFVPLLAAPSAALCMWLLLAGGKSAAPDMVRRSLTGVAYLPTNLRDFLAHWCLLVPLTIPWLVLRGRRLPWLLVSVAAGLAVPLTFVGSWVVWLAAATAVALCDIALDACARRDRDQFAIWLALLAPLPVVFYLHLPSKYLLPSVPFAVALIARSAATKKRLAPTLAVAGFAAGLCILIGIHNLAVDQRMAVERLIVPRLRAGERVWYCGQWGFHWYAEQAGARPLTVSAPYPAPNDIVVVSFLGVTALPKPGIPHTVLKRISDKEPGLRVMGDGAGFFSNWFGHLPFTWSTEETGVYEVWRATGGV